MALAVPEDVSRALAAEIKDRREASGMSQAQMSNLAGFRWTTSYQRLEYHDSVVNILQLVAIANVLGTTSDELMAVAQQRARQGRFPTPPTAP